MRERNKKEEDHDAEVLENDGPTPSRKPTETIRIIRENTHRRRGVDKVIVGLLVFISVLLVIGCVLLGLVLKDEDTKSSPSPPPPSPPPLKLPPPPPLPYSPPSELPRHPPPLPYPTPSKIPPPPPPSSETPLSSAAQEIVEYKEIKWNPLGYNPYQSFTTQQL